MFRVFQVLFVATLLMAPTLIAKPTKPPTSTSPEPKTIAVPKIPAMTNWGECAQDGKKFTLTGDLEWSAKGAFTDDGRVSIIWLEIATGDLARSLYIVSIVDGKIQLQGVWGYERETEFQEGVLTGNILDDAIYEVDVQEKPE